MKKRGIAILLACCMALPMAGCDLSTLLGQSSESASSAGDATSERYDLNRLQTRIEDMKDVWTDYGHEDLMEENTQFLLDEFDALGAEMMRAEMEYYADWKNAEKERRYDELYEDYYVAWEMLSWVFTNGAYKSVYMDFFQPYAEEEYKDYYLAYSLSKVKTNARRDSGSYGDTLDDYYDIAYRDDKDDEESFTDSNLQCAQLYLDTLANYDLSDYLYDSYRRDYEAADVSAMYGTILQDIYPIFDAYWQALEQNPLFERLGTQDFVVDDNPFETIHRFAPRLSDTVAESAEKIWAESLYLLAEDDQCYDGSYTVALPGEQSAMIYLYQAGDYYDLVSAVHEFGHFHADWRDTTPLYCQENCIDVAEVQSQGMQLLFTQFYNEIYGDKAQFMENLAIYDILDSVIAGFAVGEFEYRVMRAADTLTAQEVVDMFYEIADACDLGRDLYEITHLYEQPGYYISYGVSALAALQIYAVMQESPAEAQALYDRISAVPSVSTECHFRQTLADCGFSDIFDPATLDELVAWIPNPLQE